MEVTGLMGAIAREDDDQVVDELIAPKCHPEMNLPRILPILGPSGCGKSSLARAGFIPELAREPLSGKVSMRIAVMVPGARPLEALAGVLAKTVTEDPFPVEKTEEFERILKKQNEVDESEGLRRITNLIPNIRDMPLVILVDQFEEVYSLCKDAKQRQSFIDNLLHAASEPTCEVSVVITLRSDFLDETQIHSQFNQVIGSDHSVFVPAMNVAELRCAITEPAKREKYSLDEAVVDLLIKDTEGREGALPLLQFSLARIWDGLRKGKTPAATYRKMGGVGGALAGKAQEIYDRLSQSEQMISRRVFVGLVQIGEGTRDTRRRVRVDRLIAKQDKMEAVQNVLRQFSSFDARLITLSNIDGNEMAEVTHEALFEHWQQLNSWLNSSRDDIRFHRRLETVVRYWENQGKAEGLLWRSPDLDLLREYQQRNSDSMTAAELAFWHSSERAEQILKRARRLVTGGLVFGLVLTTLSSGIAFWNVRKAHQKTAEASLNNVKVLAQSAATLNTSGDTFEALIMALRAAKQFSDNELVDLTTLNQIKGEFYSSLFQENREVTRFEGHSDTVVNSRFSPDSQIIATASLDGTTKLWAQDGKLIATLESPRTTANVIGFSPNGKTLATATTRGIIAKLWQTDGSLITTLNGHSNSIKDIQFSHDGQTLATASLDSTAKLWQADGSLITTLKGHSDAITNVQFSPNNQTLATASSDGTAKLWQADGSLITTLKGHSDAVTNVQFSSNNQTLATASSDGTAKLWQTDGSLITTLKGHSDAVTNVQFSPNNQTLATASSDGTAKLWQADGNLIATFEGPSDAVRDVQFSPDGQTLATVIWDGTVKLWQTDGSLIATFEGPSYAVRNVQFSPDGQTLATVIWDDNIAKLWQISGSLITTLEAHSDAVTSVQFSPGGQTLATASSDNTAKLWQVDGSLITTLKAHSDAVTSVQFSPDGQTLATASSDGTAKLWQTDGYLIKSLEGHSDAIRDVQFSPDSQILATSSSDNTIRLWQTDGYLIKSLEGHSDTIRDMQFSPDGQTLATSSSDNTTRLWQTDGSLIAILEGHNNTNRSSIAALEVRSDTVWAVQFSPDGQTLVTANDDGTIELWQADGSPIALIEGHSDGIGDIQFSTDGKIFATAGHDGTAKLWQSDGSLIATLEGHSEGITAVRFSTDGKIFATASHDGTAKLWQADGSLMATLEGHSNAVRDMQFSPDSTILATVSSDNTVKLWPLSLDELLSYTCQNIEGYLLSNPNIEPSDKKLCDQT